MPLRYVEGDLFDSGEGIVLHGCNARGAFAKGFAGIVRKTYPEAYEAYMAVHGSGRLILGSVVWASSGRTLIGNCITQPTYGRDGRRHVSYDAVRACMRAVNIAAVEGVPGTPFEEGFTKVAMPLIGTDLGGGDWAVIEKIVAEELHDCEANVYVLPGHRPSASDLADASLHR